MRVEALLEDVAKSLWEYIEPSIEALREVLQQDSVRDDGFAFF